MSYNNKNLNPYIDLSVDLIPLHPWNKLIKGDERGKTPRDREWNSATYTQNKKTYLEWSNSGYNIGYRIPEDQLIVDLDPRNYEEGIDSEELVADLFGYMDFEELVWDQPVVHTGSGGYHIYCTLPEDVTYQQIRKCTPNLPGVDFKKKGGYVVAAGSKHPNGNYYEWENITDLKVAPEALLNLIKRDKFEKKDYVSGYGAFNGTQLQQLVLDKLDVEDFGSNDEWEPLLMECHHATAGDGIEEFLEWCLGDPTYINDENKIRNRWESLDDTNENSRTAASLIRRLKTTGEGTNSLRAILDFGNQSDFEDMDDEDTEESQMLKEAKDAANTIEISDIVDVPRDKGGVEGAAMQAAKDLDKHSTMEDKMKVMRLIKAATLEEAIEAQEIIVANKVMNQSAINKRLKALEAKILDSVTEILANTTIDTVFKKGKHIITEPNKQVWVFHKTHWKPMSDEYLGKIIYGVLDTLKTKMTIEAQEVTLVTAAVKGIRMRSSVLTSRLFNTDNYLPVINCSNGEVWINKDGSHSLKPHTYRSYQLRCLNVNYDPAATCELFMQTLEEIFSLFEDTEDMIRHMGEIMGYIIQPYKPDANWWMFRGPGGDGKSTIIKILDGILGDALYSADENLLGTGGGGGNAHALTGLVGKLAVVIEELKAGKALNDSGLKLLSENTKMTANPKNKEEFPFKYVGSLIMCSNFFPVIRDTSEGTIRRANIIPFNRQFVKTGKADSNRSRKILEDKDELAGVLNFMLEGYQRYSTRGHFSIPDSCAAAKDEWLCEANNVVRFVKENIIVRDQGIRLDLASSVYKRYERWCDNSGIRPKGRNNFYSDLGNLGIIKKTSSSNSLYLYGGDLLEEEIDDFDDF
jgi:P4 family phage/plasmid primase-like protien